MLARPSREGIGLIIADMAYRRVGVDRLEAAERHRQPSAVAFLPVSGRGPLFRFDARPTVGEPQRWLPVAAVAHELEPFAVAHKPARDAQGTDQDSVRWALVVEREAFAVVSDRMDALREREEAAGVAARLGRTPADVVGGHRRVLCERMEDVGQHELLMLLLVIQADLEGEPHFAQLLGSRVADE